jgi:TonB-linked SusC/RagA family outer membrane protein
MYKLYKTLISCILLVAGSHHSVFAQTIRVSGAVTDEAGESLPGVSIMVKSTNNGTTSDTNGKYSLEVADGNAILVFSFVGFTTQTVEVANRTSINVSLVPDIAALGEVVVVSYGTQKKESVIGSITTVEPEKLKVPSSNLTTALAGRVAGIIAYQRSGEPGVDNASFFIRGVTTFGYKKDPLILLDNNEITSRELARLQPDDIASFSVMKDATATSLYGSRGANGVILVTTKRGIEGKATINIRMENSFSMPTQNIALADPVTYMKLNNEAIQTRGLSGKGYGEYLYSQSKINHTISGDNPYVYPANDWYKQTFKRYAQNKRLNFNLSGGDKVARYYMAGTINKDNGLLNVDKRNNFNSNIDLKSYLLRSNITINATKTTEVTVRLQGMFDDYQGPIGGGDAIYRQVMRTNPVRFPAYYLPDEANAYTKHIMFGNYGEIDPGTGAPRYNNPYASLTSGYRNYTTSQIMAQAELRQKLDFVLEGLAVRGLFNTNRYSNYEVRRFYNPFYYAAPESRYNKETDTYILTALNPTTGTEALGYNEPLDRKLITSTTYMEAAINWDHIYNEKHAVSGLLVMTRREQLNANAGDLQRSLPYRNMSTAGRFTYAFDSRYFAEFNFGYNGSERFAKKERFGFFPSAGLAYIVSNEDFWDGRIKEIVNKLKFRGTYGLVGNDAIGDENDRFFYLSNVNLNDDSRGASFGTSANERLTGVSISRYANDLITWETAAKLNVGIELNLLGKLEIQADVFSENRRNILMTRASNSTSGLQANVRANVGEAKSHGFDMSASYDHTFSNGIWLTGMGNFTYATSEFTVVDEPDYSTTPWRSRVGTSLNQIWGLVAERLFVDDEEVRNSPKQFGEYMGGDIKYKDINRDGIINEQDVVAQGYPTVPEIVYGFGISAGKERFDFSFFFQGLARESFQMNAFETSPFVNDENALLKAYADDHWSEDNRNVHALWPRLSPTRVENNMQGSTWVLRNGAFLRLKSVELGYTVPSKITSRAKMTNLRIYCSGTNLLTFSKFKLWDPELGGNRDANGNGMGYPIQKVYNIGVQLSF